MLSEPNKTTATESSRWLRAEDISPAVVQPMSSRSGQETRSATGKDRFGARRGLEFLRRLTGLQFDSQKIWDRLISEMGPAIISAYAHNGTLLFEQKIQHLAKK
jgi:hypothetical protein